MALYQLTHLVVNDGQFGTNWYPIGTQLGSQWLAIGNPIPVDNGKKWVFNWQ